MSPFGLRWSLERRCGATVYSSQGIPHLSTGRRTRRGGSLTTCQTWNRSSALCSFASVVLRLTGRVGLEIAGENGARHQRVSERIEAATNNCLARRNKSRPRAEATNKRDGSAAQFHIGPARAGPGLRGQRCRSLYPCPFSEPGEIAQRPGSTRFWGPPPRRAPASDKPHVRPLAPRLSGYPASATPSHIPDWLASAVRDE